MAERFTVSEVLDLLENDEFGLSDGDESEFEGDNMDQYGYTTPTRNRNVSQLYAIPRNARVTTPKSF